MNTPSKEFPVARDDGLLVERVGAETVIYDTKTGGAHCLTPVAAAVFARCDGRNSTLEIAHQVSTELGEVVAASQVEEALAQLEERELLIAAPGGGSSRREMLRRTAAITAAAASAPLVSSIVAPSAMAAVGSCKIGQSCTSPGFDCGANPPGMTCKCGPCATTCGNNATFVCSLHNPATHVTLPCCTDGSQAGKGCGTPGCDCSGC